MAVHGCLREDDRMPQRVTPAAAMAAIVLATMTMVTACDGSAPGPAAGASVTATTTPSGGAATPSASPGSSAGTSASATPHPSATVKPPTPTDTAPSPAASATPGASAPPTASAGSAPSASPTASPSEDPGTPATPPATPTPEPSPSYAQRGAAGDEVTALQQRLRELGYWITDADGDFGFETQQAVWAFQKAAGLARDGVVGPATQQALAEGVRPQAQSTQGHVIEIDLAKQLVLAVDDGEVVMIINASSGNGKSFEAKGKQYTAYTPTGTYTTYREYDRDYSSGLELGQMWRPKFFVGGIALHGSPSIPPYPASHGCIRVSNAAMNWIWDTWTAPLGTTVIVY